MGVLIPIGVPKPVMDSPSTATRGKPHGNDSKDLKLHWSVGELETIKQLEYSSCISKCFGYFFLLHALKNAVVAAPFLVSRRLFLLRNLKARCMSLSHLDEVEVYMSRRIGVSFSKTPHKFTKHFRYLQWGTNLYKLYVSRIVEGKTHHRNSRISFITSTLGTWNFWW